MEKRDYSSTFVPIIYAHDYDDYAASFLRRYGYDDCIVTPQAVPIFEIAEKRIGLNVQFARLSKNGDDISGLIALEDGIVDIYDDGCDSYIGVAVKKGDVLLEAFCNNPGRINNSLAHECIHWWLHRLYFIHRKGVAVAFRCPTKILEEVGEKPTDEEWMEIQARGISGRILMPKEATLKKVQEIIESRGLNHERATSADYEGMADELAKTFMVSREAVLVRLSQLNYIRYNKTMEQCRVTPDKNEVESSHKALIGQRIKRIGAKDFFREYCRNEALRDILSKQQFKYIDGYFVINNPKYITVTSDARKVPILTEYAREHLEECTLGFIYKRKNIGTPQSLTDILFRKQDADAYTATASYINDIENSSVLLKASRSTKLASPLSEKYAEFKAIKKTYTLGEAIDIILKVRGIQVQEASWQTGLATSQVTRLKSNTHKHTLRLLTQFCAGLGLEPYIARDLIDKAGISITNPTEEDFAYLSVIDTKNGYSIDEINIYLTSIGISPFNIAKENL